MTWRGIAQVTSGCYLAGATRDNRCTGNTIRLVGGRAVDTGDENTYGFPGELLGVGADADGGSVDEHHGRPAVTSLTPSGPVT